MTSHRTYYAPVASVLLMTFGLLALGGCEDSYSPGSRAFGGGLLGGGTGAAIGALAGGGQGAAIGALAGGVLGATAGAITTPNQNRGYQQGYSPYGYAQGNYPPGNYPPDSDSQGGYYSPYSLYPQQRQPYSRAPYPPQQPGACPPETVCTTQYPYTPPQDYGY